MPDVFPALPSQVEDLYYHKFTQGVLWPLFHCIPTNFNEALLENFQSQYEVRRCAPQQRLQVMSASNYGGKTPAFVRLLRESDFATVENTNRLGATDTPEYLGC